MQITYDSIVLEFFKNSLHDQRRWMGINAKNWGEYIFENLSDQLDKKFTRVSLLNKDKMANLTDEELSIVILSWGGMNREHGKSLFKNREWLKLVDLIRNSKLKRSEAYDQFKTLRKLNKLKGMGPAYFTKLICFVNPSVGGYIMDQWTSKSINLLLGKNLVKLTSSGMVSDNNNSKIYEEFCLVIEDLAGDIQKDSIETEEMLFNYGGRQKGIWRQYVIENWGANQFTPTKRKFKTKTINKIDMTDMERIDYKDAVNYYDNTWLDIRTLGKRKSLFVKSSEGSIFLRNSQNGELRIDQPHWNAVMERIEELPQEERSMASRYVPDKYTFSWNDAPNKIFSPYVPAIVRYMIENPG